MKNLHINAPQVTDKTITIDICPDCKKRTRMLSFFTPWYGWESTCIKCGRSWSESEWMPLDFVRQSRQKSVAAAKRRWRKLSLGTTVNLSKKKMDLVAELTKDVII